MLPMGVSAIVGKKVSSRGAQSERRKRKKKREVHKREFTEGVLSWGSWGNLQRPCHQCRSARKGGEKTEKSEIIGHFGLKFGGG